MPSSDVAPNSIALTPQAVPATTTQPSVDRLTAISTLPSIFDDAFNL
jgi:hypothetical protein